MTLKTYCKLLFHALVTMLIILSLPITLCVVLNSNVPDWVTIVSSLASASITIFFGIKYVIFIVWKKDIFKDMF